MHRASPLARLAALTAALTATGALAAEPGHLRAAATSGAVTPDGLLDEPDWTRAAPFTAFVEVFPGDGAPTQATEVRVLLGEKALYVGVRCAQAPAVPATRPLGRRDHPPPSDLVTVLVDAANDRRAALRFTVTAGGVLADAQVFDDDQESLDWDATWEAGVRHDAAGWTAELAIPLSALPRAPGEGASWGFGVIREVAATHERMATFPIPREVGGLVTRLGRLDGLDAAAGGVAGRGGLEVMPYLALRGVARPRYADPARPEPRLADATGDLGVDLRAPAGGATFTATVNPDFGQVEADQLVLNLSSYETFFPEKRPFFTEGADAFQPVGAGREAVPHRISYSRRIGLDVPILAAAKLAGPVVDGLQVGILDAVVADATQPSGASEDAPDRSWHWHPARPLHLGPGDALPASPAVSRNHLAGVARLRVAPGLVTGLQVAAATPLAAPCSAADAALGAGRPPACDALGAEAVALDLNAASADGAWYLYGQAAGSRASAGPPERTLRDGTVLARGDLGAGAYLRAGKRGGEPLRFDLGWTYASPGLELNPTGFQRTQNEQAGQATVRLVRTELGPFHEARVYATGTARWTTDGRSLPRGRTLEAGFYAVLSRPYLTANCWAQVDDPQYDVREIAGTGVPLRRPAQETVTCDLATDEAKPLSVELYGYAGRNRRAGALPAPSVHGANVAVAWRPAEALETRLEVNYDRFAWPARYLDGDGTSLRFAALTAPTASLTLRQLVALSPRLTFQLYGQLFAAEERYGAGYRAAAEGRAPIEPGRLVADPLVQGVDGRSGALVVNAVLRWEHRPGAVLWLVYARDQRERPAAEGAAVPPGLAPRGLSGGPVTDSILVKWSIRLGG